MRDWVAHAAWSVVAALIVFEYVADPGDAYLWQLVAVSAVGPLLVPRAVSGLVWLLRWWRRHTSHTNEPRIPSA